MAKKNSVHYLFFPSVYFYFFFTLLGIWSTGKDEATTFNWENILAAKYQLWVGSQQYDSLLDKPLFPLASD